MSCYIIKTLRILYYHSLELVRTFLCCICEQVVQKSGRVIGSCEIIVSNDRVDISRLGVDVVSGLSLDVGAKTDFPGALSVRVTKTSLMHRRYQVTTVLQCRLLTCALF